MLYSIVFRFDNYVDDLELMKLELFEAINHEQQDQNVDYFDIEILYFELIQKENHRMLASCVLLSRKINQIIFKIYQESTSCRKDAFAAVLLHSRNFFVQS